MAEEVPEVVMTPYEFRVWARRHGMDETTIDLLCRPMGVETPPFLYGQKSYRRRITLRDRRGPLEFK